MKVSKRIFITFILSTSLLISCNITSPNSTLSTQINSRNLVFEVNNELQTKFSIKLLNVKPVLNDFQSSERLIVQNNSLGKFRQINNVIVEELEGSLKGKKWIFIGVYKENSIDITKTLVIRVYDIFPDLISTQVTYTNNTGDDIFINKWINNGYRILSQNDSPLFWAFQGSSSQERSDWIKPVETGYYQKNFMGMNDTDYGGGIPVTSVWRSDINIAVGHLAMSPKQVNLPTEIPSKNKDIEIAVTQDFKDRTLFKSKQHIQTLETFISISKGDYYTNLNRYSKLMQAKGIEIAASEDAAYESIWCAWGYERKFTLDEVIGTLPKVKELGIKWVVLDDGFQIAEGNWNVNPKKFPKGDIEIKNFVKKIHKQGLKAKIWWTPLAADPQSKALIENPDMRIFKRDESPQFITWWDAYLLSPTKKETINYTKETIQLFMEEWGFDGLKMDGQHMNAVDLDYSLDNPESAPESLPDFFQMIYDEARSINSDAVIENCPCGTCMSYFNMASMNQAVSSDPLSSWQIRHKGKTYKALIPNTAYYGDHVELSDNASDFASSFGIGAVLGTKFTWPKDNPFTEDGASYLLTPEKEKKWKKWFSLYNEKLLSKEEYIGDLYDIGYDKPETHVIKKNNTLYFAFYAKKWNGKIELRGLDKNTIYTVKDYFNTINLGEVSSKNPILKTSFKDFLLLEVSPK